MNHLGMVYSRRGRWQDADALLNSARELWRRTFGEEHAETLRTIDQLGDVCFRRGDFAEAETLLTKAFEARRRVLGPDHPDSLRSAVHVAELYREIGRSAEAESMFVETLATERKLFGDEHPDTPDCDDRTRRASTCDRAGMSRRRSFWTKQCAAGAACWAPSIQKRWKRWLLRPSGATGRQRSGRSDCNCCFKNSLAVCSSRFTVRSLI